MRHLFPLLLLADAATTAAATVVESEGRIALEMGISCSSDRARCDALFRELEAHDARLPGGDRPAADPGA